MYKEAIGSTWKYTHELKQQQEASALHFVACGASIDKNVIEFNEWRRNYRAQITL